MEAKLKSLKVVDLKQILTKANVAPAGKANKADLIAKIIASPAAVDAFNAIYPSAEPAPAANDDLLAPPEDLDWTVEEVPPSKSDDIAPDPTTKTPAEPAKASASEPTPTSEPSKASTTTESTLNTVDADLEKRKQRAARFGIPLVEPKTKNKSKQLSVTAKKTDTPATQPSVDAAKLQGRAQRFGLKTGATAKALSGKDNQTSPDSKRKRSAVPAADVDPEEAERRRKRAERFGLKV
ncbi:hypothetical protein DFH05DRAFT_1475518 [Lentinula detonsa]|uniref:THO1-MOS11 C-terminal domain-containing protein n=1 Tax=Lentinula detonsa TaxID=2804962 RepID=A0A9W8U1H7_9AGAR|nr:hypothetical protein DFH05DRAFT_1475518 [Lentinula detonsa]